MTNDAWKYVFEAEGYDRLVTSNSIDGWEEQKISIKRSPTYWGLFRNISTTLKFTKEAYTYIRDIYEREGTEFLIYIGIYEYNPPPTDKYFLYFSGLLDLSTYNIKELFIDCDVNESSVARKIVSRDDIKIAIGQTSSIENIDINQVNPITIQIHERNINRIATYERNDQAFTTSSSISPFNPNMSGVSVAITKIGGEIDNTVEPFNPEIDQIGSFFWESGIVDSSVNLQGSLKCLLTRVDVLPPSDHLVAFRVYDDNTLSTYTDTIVATVNGQLSPAGLEIDTDFDVNLSADKNNFIAFVVYRNNADFFVIEFQEAELQITQDELFDPTQTKGYLMHEVGQNIVESITDKRGVFYSDFFGRTDINYPQNGERAFSALSSAKQIRAIPAEQPSISLRDWFKSMNSQYSMGLGIEYDEVGQPVIRVEEKKHFFSGEVIATIHDVSEIEKTIARELIYNEIEVGYRKAEYEEVNGLEEYNNKFEWATYIKTIKNKLDLVSTVRADPYGVEFVRRKQYETNATEDTKEDNDNFTFLLNNTPPIYTIERNENYDFVQNIFSPETAYNLDITPGRMLRNNGYVIRAGLQKYLSEPVSFRFAEQKANLRAQKTGEGPIQENEDIDASTLSAPLWKPEFYKFKAILTRELLAQITRKPNGIIKFSTTSKEYTTSYYYGWLWDFDGSSAEKTGDFTLLAVDLTSPNVTLIDPEGSTPEQDPIDVTPSDTAGVFEGPFEFILVG